MTDPPSAAEHAAQAQPVGRSTVGIRRIGYLLLAALSYLPVLASAPGKVAADTKQYLYLDPSRLLERAWTMWDPNIGFGTVTHQNIGYLFPMGPFYWLFQAIGSPDWIAQRLWLGSILFAAGLGMLFLFRTLGVRGAGAVIGALAFMLSPYSLDYAARISVLLLPWAGLPWLLGLLIRGLRHGGWRHAAWFALSVQIIGGVNATALVFIGIAPMLWLLHSVFVAREVKLRRAISTGVRFGVLTVTASLWWIAGLWAQGSYGINILKYTETLRAVSRTSLPNEVLRGLGYWFFYGKDKLGSWIEASPTYTQHPLVILISYGIPVLALLSCAFVTWKYRSFFMSTVVVGVVIAVGAHPYDSPTPLGAWFKEAAATSTAAFALRSTGRATPLVILGLAALLGAGANALVVRFGAVRWFRGVRVPLRLVVPAVVGVLVVVNLPALWNDTFYGTNLQRGEDVPAYWHQAARSLDRQPHATRVLELPGSDFASYRWGNTVDPITPGLMDRPYAARELIPYGSPASANLLNAFDLRVQDRSLPSSALVPMARLMGVGDYVLRNDIQFERYRVLRPDFVEALFDPVPTGMKHAASFGRPDTTTNRQYPFQDEQALGTRTARPTPPPVDVYRLTRQSPIVRAVDAPRPLYLSGDGDGIVDLASIGGLDPSGIVLDSASFGATSLRRQVKPDDPLVVTDTNRLRARRWSTITDTVGYTEGPGNHPISFDESDARLDMFPNAARNASTTVVLQGARRVGATDYGNPISYTPEDRAALAFDGDLLTAWKTGAFKDVRGDRILVETTHPISTDHVNLVQVLTEPRGRWITNAILRFDGRHPTPVTLGAESRTGAGATLLFPRRRFSTLSIEIRDTNLGQLQSYGGIDQVGFAEIRLQGDGAARPVRIREVTVLPTDLVGNAAARSGTHPLAFTMSRERVIPVPPRRDPERSMTRQILVPTARSFGVGAEARLSSAAPDEVIDRDLGYRGNVRVHASARLPGAPRDRASAAVDDDPTTAWVTPFVKVVGQSVTVTSPTTRTLDHLDLQVVADGRHSVPTRLEIRNEAGESRMVDIAAVPDGTVRDGAVAVPVSFPALSGRTLSFTIRAIRMVTTHEWYCECELTMPAGIAELGIANLSPVRVPAETPNECRADLLTIDGHPVSARVAGSTDAALSLSPLRIERCDGPARPAVAMTPGRHEVQTGRGDVMGWNLDRVVLASTGAGTAEPLGDGPAIELRSSPAVVGVTTPAGSAPTPAPKVRVTGQTATKIRAEVSGASKPFWFVLGQSVNAGWRATVDGRDLGESTLVNGYANGWRVRPRGSGPIIVELEWVPQRTVNLALAVSGVAALLCLGIGLIGLVRRRRVRRAGAPTEAESHATSARPLRGWTAPAVSGRSRAERPPTQGVHDDAGRSPIWMAPWDRAYEPKNVVARAMAVIVSGGFAAVAVAPWVGLLTAVLITAAAFNRIARIALRLAPAVALAGCGAYIAAKQIHAEFPATFEWPTFFGAIRTLGWMVIVFLLADALLGTRRRPDEEGGSVDGEEAVAASSTSP